MSKPLSFALLKDGEPFPAQCGAYPLRVGNLARALTEQGHFVSWHASTFSHYEHRRLTYSEATNQNDPFRLVLHESGVYLKNISPARWLHHARLAYHQYRALLTEESLDLIFCCIPTLESALAAIWAGQRLGIPVVLDIRDPWPEALVLAAPRKARPVMRLLLAPYFALARKVMGEADSLTAVSETFLEWAQSLGQRQETTQDRVFYHGSHTIELTRSVPHRSDSITRVVYVGGFSTIYEFATLEKALQAGLAGRPDIEFLLIGEGGAPYQELRSRLEQYENVTFTGWLEREKAYELAAGCDLGWLPLKESHSGFLPNKPFEYASLGLALLSSAQGEVQELLDRHGAGFSYREQNASQFCELLLQLAGNKSRMTQAGENAFKFWEQYGDARKAASRLADHLVPLARAQE